MSILLTVTVGAYPAVPHRSYTEASVGIGVLVGDRVSLGVGGD
jgi:hypothetical protein